MKKLIIFILCMFSTIIAQDITKDLKTLQYKATEHTYTPYPNGCYIPTMYFTMVGDENAIYDGKLVIQYKETNPNFHFHSMTIEYDGKYYNVDVLLSEDESLINGYVKELKWDTRYLDIPMFRDIANSKNVKISISSIGRLVPDHSHEINMSQNELIIFKEYFQVFDKYLGESIVSSREIQKAYQRQRNEEGQHTAQIGFVIFVIGMIIVFWYVFMPKKSLQQKLAEHKYKLEKQRGAKG